MQQSSRALVGRRDFAAFGKAPQGGNTVRHLMRANWSVEGRKLTFEITANAFLYRMVRNIVGTLLQVGLGQLAVGEVKHILKAGQLSRSGPPAPACGLCLVQVTYPEKISPSTAGRKSETEGIFSEELGNLEDNQR